MTFITDNCDEIFGVRSTVHGVNLSKGFSIVEELYLVGVKVLGVYHDGVTIGESEVMSDISHRCSVRCRKELVGKVGTIEQLFEEKLLFHDAVTFEPEGRSSTKCVLPRADDNHWLIPIMEEMNKATRFAAWSTEP